MNPTPVSELITDTGNRLFVKREDLLPFGMGGNKVRIANAFFDDFYQKGCDTMVAYGGTSSNLCRVIANRCEIEKIPCFLICSQENGQESKKKTSNTRLMELFGATLIPCRKDGIAPVVEAAMEGLKKEGRHPYYIYGNKFGTGNEGVPVRAYAEAYAEILEDEKRLGITFDYLFLASGTGATQGGLICGHLQNGDSARIIGISVSRDRERGTSILAKGVHAWLLEHPGCLSHPFAPEKEILLEDGYRAGGYGHYDSRILSVIRRELLQNSLPLDPVYTGKAFWGMEQYLKQHQITNKNILFLHTGGTPLFYDCLWNGEIQMSGKESSCSYPS